MHQYISADVLFLRTIAECFAGLIHRLGICLFVRLSVHLSVTPWHCIKTVQAKIKKIFTIGCIKDSRSLVFPDKILYPLVWGFPSNEGIKERYLL